LSYSLDDNSVAEFDEHSVTVIRGVFAEWIDTRRAGMATSPPFPDVVLAHSDNLDIAEFPMLST
jgi:hypothetical protein